MAIQTNIKDKWEIAWSHPTMKFKWANRPCPPEILEAYEASYLPKKGSVVDIGCGLAEIAAWFSNYNYEVDAFDISTQAIQKAKLKNEGLKINFFVHDICKSPLPKKYNILIDRCCLHTIPLDLLARYAQHISESTEINGKLLIFLRAFRGTLKMSRLEETDMLTSNIKHLFLDHFEIESIKTINLSSDEALNMPGLAFFLRRNS